MGYTEWSLKSVASGVSNAGDCRIVVLKSNGKIIKYLKMGYRCDIRLNDHETWCLECFCLHSITSLVTCDGVKGEYVNIFVSIVSLKNYGAFLTGKN